MTSPSGKIGSPLKSALHIARVSLPPTEDIHSLQCLNRASKIRKDSSHPLWEACSLSQAAPEDPGTLWMGCQSSLERTDKLNTVHVFVLQEETQSKQNKHALTFTFTVTLHLRLHYIMVTLM